MVRETLDLPRYFGITALICTIISFALNGQDSMIALIIMILGIVLYQGLIFVSFKLFLLQRKIFAFTVLYFKIILLILTLIGSIKLLNLPVIVVVASYFLMMSVLLLCLKRGSN